MTPLAGGGFLENQSGCSLLRSDFQFHLLISRVGGILNE